MRRKTDRSVRACTSCLAATHRQQYCLECTNRYTRVRAALTTRARAAGRHAETETTSCQYCGRNYLLCQIDARYYVCYNCSALLRKAVRDAQRASDDPAEWLAVHRASVSTFLAKLRAEAPAFVGSTIPPRPQAPDPGPDFQYGPITDGPLADCPPVDLGPLCPPIDGLPENEQ